MYVGTYVWVRKYNAYEYVPLKITRLETVVLFLKKEVARGGERTRVLSENAVHNTKNGTPRLDSIPRPANL
jgi:hypothetical protein